MIKVSVIVPIYNVESYLERGLNSLLNQTLKNIEIILINDGSTDNSEQICRRFKDIDERIILINKENEGVSIARNMGIENAKGDYIIFMDPDDDVDETMYEALYMAIEEYKCDICMCNYKKIDGNVVKKVNLPYTSGLHEKKTVDDLMLDMISRNTFDGEAVMGSPWRAIYRRDIIRQNNISFPKDIRPMQDLIFNLNYLKYCKSLYIIEDYYYNYYVHEGSGVTGYRPNKFDNNIKVYEMIKKCMLNENNQGEVNKRLQNRWLALALGSIRTIAHEDNPDKLISKYKEINKILNNKNTIEASHAINTQNLMIKNKILIYLTKAKKGIILYNYYKMIKKLKKCKNKFTK